MKGSKLGFVSYEDKLLELKNYIETKINDIININYGETLIEANSSTNSEDICVYGQFYFNPDIRVVYLHINLDHYSDIINDIKNELINSIYIEERVDIVINTSMNNINDNQLTKDVFSYWTNLYGNYEFLKDKRIHNFDKYNKIMEYEFTKFDEYKHQLYLLNNKYNKFIDNTNILAGFDEYKSFYELYFGRQLSPISDSDIIRFSLYKENIEVNDNDEM